VVEAYQTREDRIVAEFGDGYDVEGIALRYGLSVEQVYEVVRREVAQPVYQPPQAYYPPPYFPHEDAIMAEYSEGHPVEAIAYRYGITRDQVYAIVQRLVAD
jgi:Mor family transcriptional regulator